MDILVVDDMEMIRSLLSDLLEKEGHTVRTAEDGVSALALLDARCPDLIIADIEMPRMDGFSLLREVRKRPSPPEVVLLTGDSRIESSIEALRCGAYDYLIKPIRGELLLGCIARVSALHDARRAEEEARARFFRASRLATVSTLATGACHELNNPLCFMRGNTEMLLDRIEELDAILEQGDHAALAEKVRILVREGRGLLQSVLRGTHRIAQVATGLAAFCNACDFEAPTETCLNACVHDALLLTASSWPCVKVDLDLDESLPLYFCSRQAVTQALT